jgi:hypothetical protein
LQSSGPKVQFLSDVAERRAFVVAARVKSAATKKLTPNSWSLLGVVFQSRMMGAGVGAKVVDH